MVNEALAQSAGFAARDRTGPVLWQRADSSDAPRVGGLHLQYGSGRLFRDGGVVAYRRGGEQPARHGRGRR